jgi:drug/metabolite transporter (DMT)-like permease
MTTDITELATQWSSQPNRGIPLSQVPVFGSVLAIALLGERLQFFHAVGYLLVLAGITLATRR